MKKALLEIGSKLNRFMLAGVVFAQGTDTVVLTPGGDFAGLEQFTIPNMIPVVIRLVLIIAALVALIFLIIGGIKWITSGGDKSAVESARGTITNALIGLLIVFGAWAIIRLIEFFFNIKILSLEIPRIPTTPY